MPGLPPPLLLALIPSEVVHQDTSGHYSALHFLNAIRPSAYPVSRRIGLFVALTAVRRRTQILLELVKPDGATEFIIDFDLHYPSYDPIEVYQHGGNATITFYAPGDHRFRVSADGGILGEWTVRLF